MSSMLPRAIVSSTLRRGRSPGIHDEDRRVDPTDIPTVYSVDERSTLRNAR